MAFFVGLGAPKMVFDHAVTKTIARDLRVNGSQIEVSGMPIKANCLDVLGSEFIDVMRERQSCGATLNVRYPVVWLPGCKHVVTLRPLGQRPIAAALKVPMAHTENLAKCISGLASELVPAVVFSEVKIAFDSVAPSAIGIRT